MITKLPKDIKRDAMMVLNSEFVKGITHSVNAHLPIRVFDVQAKETDLKGLPQWSPKPGFLLLAAEDEQVVQLQGGFLLANPTFNWWKDRFKHEPQTISKCAEYLIAIGFSNTFEIQMNHIICFPKKARAGQVIYKIISPEDGRGFGAEQVDVLRQSADGMIRLLSFDNPVVSEWF